MTIIQINSMHDYRSAASILKFSNVPFGRLKCLHLSHTLPFHVCYKLAFTESLYYEASILRTRRTEQILKVLPAVRQLNKKPELSADKRKDLESMLKFIPSADAAFMEHRCKIGKQRPK